MEHNDVAWKVIDTYFSDNPEFLIQHHIESYNDFVENEIKNTFIQASPIVLQQEENEDTKIFRLQSKMYLGGKDGSKIYLGKPTIYDENNEHLMLPNEARLRNMTYGMTIHFDVEIDITIVNDEGVAEQQEPITLSKLYLGKIPIMLKSKPCVLRGLNKEILFNMGECRNDPGGYFIIDGKEKAIVSQEKFADNMLYIREYADDDHFSHSAEIRSVSDDKTKPKRTMNVRMRHPRLNYDNGQIVVSIPNVREPIPLFIVMRALGVLTDKEIIEYCLFDLNKRKDVMYMYVPSVHNGDYAFTREEALKYISTFTKGKTVDHVINILSDYFLAHIGTNNFIDKARYLGYIVNRLVKVVRKEELPTDRDSFKFKRIELSGTLLTELFVEYFKLHANSIRLSFDKEYHYNIAQYTDNYSSLFTENYVKFFNNPTFSEGIRKAFKGNWVHQQTQNVLV